MNPNLMNPEIVTRMVRERERELRLESRGLPEAEGRSAPRPARGTRAPRRRPLTALARLLAFLVR